MTAWMCSLFSIRIADGVALAQTGLAEPMGQPVGAGFQVVEGDDGSGRVQDDSRFICADIGANLHGLTVRRAL